MQDSELAAARAAAQPDKGWDYSVCAEPDEGIRRAIEAKRKTADHRLMGVLDSAIWQEAQRVAVIAIAINPPVTAASAANEIQAWKDRLADLPQTEPEVIAAMDQADEWIAAAEARERDQ